MVLAFNWSVGWNGHYVESVGVSELGRFGGSGTCHACKLVVQPKVILKGDSRERLVFCFYTHSFFRLYCLVQTFAPASTIKDASCKFVNNSDLTVLYDVVAVAAVQLFSLQRRTHLMDQIRRNLVVQVVNIESSLNFFNAWFQHRHVSFVLFDFVVNVAGQCSCYLGELAVQLGSIS